MVNIVPYSKDEGLLDPSRTWATPRPHS